MTVRELTDLPEPFPVITRVAFDGYELGHDGRSPMQNSTVSFGTNSELHLRDGRRGDHDERLLVVADVVAAVDDLIRRRVANS